MKRADFDADLRSMSFDRDDKGQLIVVFDYVSIPPGVTNVRLTLTAPPAAIHDFAERLIAEAKQVPVSTSKH